MVHGWPLLSAALTAGVLLWGRVGHHVKREASRFIPSTLSLVAASFRVECVSSAAELHRLAAYRDFVASDDVESGIFCHPAALEHGVDFGRGEGLVLVACIDGGRTIALLPFTSARARVPLRLGVWRLASLRASLLRLCDFEFPLIRGADRLNVLGDALAILRVSVPCDLVLADNARVAPEPSARALPAGSHLRNIQRTFQIRLPETFAEYWRALGTKTRNNVSRQVRRFEERGPMTVRAFTDRGSMPELHALATDVWRRSWHARVDGGRPIGLAYLRALAENGWSRSYVLFAGPVPVAYIIGYQYRGRYYYENVAYDARWRGRSPGAVLNYFMLNDLFERDRPAVLDFGAGYNRYKEELGNVPENRGELWMAVTPRGTLVLTGMRVMDTAYRLVRGAATATGVRARWHRRLRGSPRCAD